LAWLSRGHAGALSILLGLGYAGLTGLLLWQALRAQPLIAPDAKTLMALTGLAGAVTLGATALLGHARARAPR
jgi:hypothetical protein